MNAPDNNDLDLGELVFKDLVGRYNINPLRSLWEEEFLKRRTSKIRLNEAALDQIWESADLRVNYPPKKVEIITLEELEKRKNVPLTFGDSATSCLYALGFGLFGTFFQWQYSKEFRKNGFLTKAEKSWKVFWVSLLSRVAFVLILSVCVAIYFELKNK